MLKKFRLLLADASAHWQIGLVIATVVASMLVLGLSMRARYIVAAEVEIGRVILPDSLNLLRHSSFESIGDIEKFFLEEVFKDKVIPTDASCNAEAKNFLDRSIVKINCKGKNKELISAYVLSATRRVIERHLSMFQTAQSINDKKVKRIDLQLQHIQNAISKLEANPVTVWSEARLIDHRLRMEDLIEEREQIARIEFVTTRLVPKDISVLDRAPTFGVWLAVFALALFSGFFAAAFTPIHKLIDHD